MIFKAAASAAVAAIALTVATPVSAFSPPEKTTRAKIDVSGKQRMLAQRMAKSACFAQLAAKMEYHEALLDDSTLQFRSGLNTLANGGGVDELPVENDERAILRLEDLRAAWADLERLVIVFRSSPLPERRSLLRLIEQSDAVVDEADTLVKTYRSIGAVEETTMARTIDLAGRQRMLIQRASKDLCLLALKIGGEAYRAELRETVDLFERTLSQLRQGDDAVGVAPPVDEAHRSQLERVQRLWNVLAPRFRAAIASDEVHHLDFEAVATLNEVLLAEMDRAVRSYVLSQ